jgi:hypothetical protein
MHEQSLRGHWRLCSSPAGAAGWRHSACSLTCAPPPKSRCPSSHAAPPASSPSAAPHQGTPSQGKEARRAAVTARCTRGSEVARSHAMLRVRASTRRRAPTALAQLRHRLHLHLHLHLHQWPQAQRCKLLSRFCMIRDSTCLAGSQASPSWQQPPELAGACTAPLRYMRACAHAIRSAP